ncbi:type VII secretion integral membrane protein EccD [Mycolicibacterium cosmeticum]|uniref:type VII secretion integral membrane protein EccD n=1 Tax=Mycolicibacterium cosmeticum TaxID=258533 RepID=UPI00055D580B|nr:type VII secretion integral membrane protein EccD [Mycolicibacterium cosmeticum]
MQDSWCRVAVAYAGTVTDLVFSADVAVGAALPDIVEVVMGPDSRCGHNWHLSRPCGDRLDEDMTLRQNGVRDGDVLAITAAPVPVFARAAGDFGTVAAAEAPPPAPWAAAAWAAAAWAWCATVVAATVLGSVLVSGLPVVASVTAAGIAATAAVVTRRAPTAPTSTAAAVVAVVFSGACGYLTVGTAAPIPGALLAVAAAASSAVLLTRLTAAGPVLLTAVGTCATLLAVAVAPAALWATGFGVSAAILCAAAIGALGIAARLVIVLTGLNPALPGRNDTRVTDRRARRARRVLTGIVAGAAAAAAVGCVGLVVAFSDRAAQPVLAVVVTGAVLLRCRLYADGGCRAALLIGGLASATATSVLLLRWIPGYAGGVSAAAAAVIAVLYAQREAVSPSISRIVDIVEVALLAAVIPTAAWCAGVFGVVRGLSLPW